MHPHSSRFTSSTLLAAGLLALTTACVEGEPLGEDAALLDAAHTQLVDLRTRTEDVERGVIATGIITNGIITNGIITNGIITNGLALTGPLSNGLALNGLGQKGLMSAAFASWFRAYPEADADTAMHYVVGCAVPAGSQRTWRNPETGHRFVWEGRLGLAPDWAKGRPVTRTEQQLVSACLAAMVNKYGMHVPVSVRGRDALGAELALSPGEAAFTVPEGAFFGNLFTDEGLFVCADRDQLDPAESSVRACGLYSRADGALEECPPLVHVGLCSRRCQKAPGKDYYTSCIVGGLAYPAVTTRVRPEDVYRCGDGVCQVSESCDPSPTGTGLTASQCAADCGRCQ